MFGLFDKKVPFAFAQLQIDMHAHWLPGIDDGAQRIEDSLQLIEGLYKLGYRKLIATPHVMQDLYPNTPEIILEKLRIVREAVEKNKIPVQLDAAAEYLIDEALEEKIKKNEILPLPGKRVLVEFSFISPPPNYQEIFFLLQTKGYAPILAHPERYQYWHHDLQQLTDLQEKGVALQVNLLSLVGHYGEPIKSVAEKLIKNQQVTYLGTDIHSEVHLQKFQQFQLRKKFNQLLEAQSWKNSNLA